MPKKRHRLLQIFSTYREYVGAEGSVYRIGDHLQLNNDVETFIHTSEEFSGDLPAKMLATVKAFHNGEVLERLRRYQEPGHYDVCNKALLEFKKVQERQPALSGTDYLIALAAHQAGEKALALQAAQRAVNKHEMEEEARVLIALRCPSRDPKL